MILIDSSVWIDHFRTNDPQLAALLERREVLCHPLVIGELALGSLGEREKILGQMQELPGSLVAQDHEVLYLIMSEKMHGAGIGYVDAHLLTSAKISPGTLLWTRDKRLDEVARGLRLSFRKHFTERQALFCS